MKFAIVTAGLFAAAASLLTAEQQREISCDVSVAMAFAALLDVQPSPSPTPDVTPDAKPASIEIPADGHAWRTLLVFDQRRYADPNQRKLNAWFVTNPELIRLRAETQVTTYLPGLQHYQHYLTQHKGKVPQVWIVRDDRQVAYTAAGDELPATPDELAAEIAKRLSAFTPTPRQEPSKDVGELPATLTGDPPILGIPSSLQQLPPGALDTAPPKTEALEKAPESLKPSPKPSTVGTASETAKPQPKGVPAYRSVPRVIRHAPANC